MLAQYYKDSPKIIRVFKANGTVLCDIPYEHHVANELFLDTHIQCVKLRRNNDTWHHYKWGYETKVRWR